jgi:hypothetical protein
MSKESYKPKEISFSQTATIEIVNSSNYKDSWWVNVKGETIPQPMTLEQAKTYKPKGSRVNVLVLNIALENHWIPIREAEEIFANYAYNPEREASLKLDLEKFTQSLSSKIDYMIEYCGLLTPPTDEQYSKILAEAHINSRRLKYLDSEEIVRNICPENFDPLALLDPEIFSQAKDYIFEDDDSMLLYESDANLLSMDDVLSPPTMEQIINTIKNLNKTTATWDNDENSGDEAKIYRKFAKRLGKLYPQLIKNTEEAQKFFNPSKNKDQTTQSRGGKKSNSAPVPFIQRSTNLDGKTDTTITISPIMIVLAGVVAIIGFFMLKGCFF